MKLQYRRYLVFVLVALSLVFTIVYYFSKTRNVVYEITSPDGQSFVQNWVHINKKVLTYEEEGTLYSSLGYNQEQDAYFESYYIGTSQVHFRFSKSPVEADVGEAVLGKTFIVENDVKLPSKDTIIVKFIRQDDGRTISVTTIDEGDDYMRVVTKMFDNKVSDYYLPDEIIDRVFLRGKITSTIHIVAVGRNFLPIEHVSNGYSV